MSIAAKDPKPEPTSHPEPRAPESDQMSEPAPVSALNLELLSVPEHEPAIQISPDTQHEPSTDMEPEPNAMSDQVREPAPMSIPLGLSVEPMGFNLLTPLLSLVPPSPKIHLSLLAPPNLKSPSSLLVLPSLPLPPPLTMPSSPTFTGSTVLLWFCPPPSLQLHLCPHSQPFFSSPVQLVKTNV